MTEATTGSQAVAHQQLDCQVSQTGLCTDPLYVKSLRPHPHATSSQENMIRARDTNVTTKAPRLAPQKDHVENQQQQPRVLDTLLCITGVMTTIWITNKRRQRRMIPEAAAAATISAVAAFWWCWLGTFDKPRFPLLSTHTQLLSGAHPIVRTHHTESVAHRFRDMRLLILLYVKVYCCSHGKHNSREAKRHSILPV